MDLLDRFKFSFVSTTGFHVELDFINKMMVATKANISYSVTTKFTYVGTIDQFIVVRAVYEGTKVIEFSYQVDQRYIDQFQRFS